jgi:hypothetical protein
VSLHYGDSVNEWHISTYEETDRNAESASLNLIHPGKSILTTVIIHFPVQILSHLERSHRFEF